MRNHALNLKSKKEPYHVNSPFALPKSTSLLFSVITPPFKLHFHLFFVCDTLSNCARTRFPLCVSVPGAPRASSSESELRVSPFSFSVCFSVAFLASSPAADPVVWSTLGTSSVFLRVPFHLPSLALHSFFGALVCYHVPFVQQSRPRVLRLDHVHEVGIQSPAVEQLVLPERRERSQRFLVKLLGAEVRPDPIHDVSDDLKVH
mmetsp:Transcript_6222/g.20873  ORF Transcript_6222/g.20873 Transcript_6222/m.20873 type:complete len:204 (+) Transcript_6222:656-1267(+)